MTLRRLAVLQWVGLLAGAAVWAAQHVAGLYVNYADCGPSFSFSSHLWQGVLMAVALVLVAGAQAAAVTVLLRTRDASYEDPPAIGRIRFFAIAAVVTNVLFLGIILLDGLANLFDVACRQG